MLALALVACQPLAALRSDPAGAAARGEQLAAQGDHAGAARAFESAAAQAPPARANPLWLAAARAWLDASNTVAARRSLAQLAAPVTAADGRERTRLSAAALVREDQPRQALELLATIAEPADAPLLETRARALYALGRVPEAIGALLQRGGLLRGADERLENQRMIVEGAAVARARGHELRAPAGADAMLAGWLELGQIRASAESSPLGTAGRLQAWRARYPAHPANERLWRELFDRFTTRIAAGEQIALLLPLSGRAAAAGQAVRDGFLAAYYEQPPDARPRVTVHDVAAGDAASAYRTALGDGAQIVVGPLTREEVANVSGMADGRVLTVALNYLPDGQAAPRRFYQFALSPEDEARQAARQALASGHASGLAIGPASDWGQRVLAAFADELQQGGGTLVARSSYAAGTTDFQDLLMSLLDLRPGPPDAEGRSVPVYRADAQFIFVAAQPLAGRMIRTQLRFNHASRLPVYATSDIHEPGSSGNADLNGVIFPDMPWVLSAAGPAAMLRAAADRAWPGRLPSRSRLFAFGYDAFTVVAELNRGRAPFAGTVAGVTGRLRLDFQGRVRRDLDFTRIQDGVPQPVDNPLP